MLGKTFFSLVDWIVGSIFGSIYSWIFGIETIVRIVFTTENVK